VNLSAPTYLYAPTNVKIDETNISTTLNQIQNILTTITVTNSFSQPILQQQANCGCVTSYSKSTVHPNLTGTGAFAISGPAGFEIQITSYPSDTLQLVGNPPYMWNMGWCSIDNSDGMIAEKRITQLGLLWFPEQIGVAASFNYWLPANVQISVTELARSP
jgi:hypothetical protein